VPTLLLEGRPKRIGEGARDLFGCVVPAVDCWGDRPTGSKSLTVATKAAVGEADWRASLGKICAPRDYDIEDSVPEGGKTEARPDVARGTTSLAGLVQRRELRLWRAGGQARGQDPDRVCRDGDARATGVIASASFAGDFFGT
jgi:hypothetical protein